VLVPVARLPHRRKPKDPQQLGLAVGVAGAIVLVVDDENDIRDGLSALCAQWGYQVWEARDAEDALAVLREKRVAPDILLVDYRLPDGTGVELVTRIRRRFRRRIAALILTGDAAHQPLQDAEAAGIGIVHKPVPPDVLRTRLALQLSAGKRRWRR
jgi:CheY-like chemotaxis protein